MLMSERSSIRRSKLPLMKFSFPMLAPFFNTNFLQIIQFKCPMCAPSSRTISSARISEKPTLIFFILKRDFKITPQVKYFSHHVHNLQKKTQDNS